MMMRLVILTLFASSPVLAFVGHANLLLSTSKSLNAFAVKAAVNQRSKQHSVFHSIRSVLSGPFEDNRIIGDDTQKDLKNYPEPVGVGISFYPDDENEGLLQVHAVAPYTSAKQSGIQVSFLLLDAGFKPKKKFRVIIGLRIPSQI